MRLAVRQPLATSTEVRKMAFPIITPDDLPPRGTSGERADLDFKRVVSRTGHADDIELAKDIAALANTVGGTILVGADASNSRLQSYCGVPSGKAAEIGEWYEKAAADRC